MKVFILTDMEGATGIIHRDQLVIEEKEYARGRKLLTGDVNAAVEGALDAGATEVVVCEGHGTMRNILLEDLHESASLVLGPTEYKDYCQIIGLDDSFDAAIFVGFHAKAGNEHGILSHTWVGGAVHSITVNGTVFGETALDAGICGVYQVPLVAVCGDNELAKEVKETVGNHVETIEVKQAYSRAVARCYPPAATKKWIRDGVARALKNKTDHPVFRVDEPVVIDTQFYMPYMAEKAARVNQGERIAESTIRVEDKSYLNAIARTWASISQGIINLPDWMR